MSPEPSQSHAFSLPATAVCPGCNTIVVLPAVFNEEAPPPICGTCGSEVPDSRREAAVAEAAATTSAAEVDGAEPLPEDRRYTRGNLLSALRDTVAEKGMAALSKRTPPSFRG